MKRENFYRRDPSKALSGMIGLSLEERGVYNTVLDLLYSTWRPLEDDRAFIANWCGCAVQKLNPIIRRLIDRGRLITFEEGGRTFLSDEAFEAERASVKGTSGPRSGRGKVGEKSDEVREKSAGVEKNPPTCPDDSKQNQPIAPLEKSREDQSREETPLAPKGAPDAKSIKLRKADVEAIWAITPGRSRERSSKADVERALISAARRGQAPADIQRGLAAYFASEGATKDGGEFVKGVHRMIERDRWQGFAQAPLPLIDAATAAKPGDVWVRRIHAYRQNAFWNRLDWGPPPGKPGCTVPAEVLMTAGYAPTPIVKREVAA